MYVSVKRLRHHGQPIPSRELGNATPVRGDLSVYRISGKHHYQVMAVSTPDGRRETLAQLFEPEVISITGQGMRWRGFETVTDRDGGKRTYMQEWIVALVDSLDEAGPTRFGPRVESATGVPESPAQ